MKTYTYAVIPSRGMYGSGDRVATVYRTDNLERAKAFAERATREYQDGMRRYGGSSGGYRVVQWESADKSISFGHDADRMPSL